MIRENRAGRKQLPGTISVQQLRLLECADVLDDRLAPAINVHPLPVADASPHETDLRTPSPVSDRPEREPSVLCGDLGAGLC